MRYSCSLLAFISTLSFAPQAWAYTHTWCFRHRVNAVDNNIGEDMGTADVWSAKGARVIIYNQYFVADDSGCVTFSHSSNGTTGVTFFAETRIGSNNNIRIRAWPDKASFDSWNSFPVDSRLPKWVWYVTPSCQGSTCSATVTNTSYTDAVSIMLAAGTHVVWRINDVAHGTNFTTTKHLDLVAQGCQNNSSAGSCMEYPVGPGGVAWIQSYQQGWKRKFLIGHEVGHWLHAHRIDDNLSFTTGYDPIAEDHLCSSEGVKGRHAMRSTEYVYGAFIEGFAHFLSAVGFNYYSSTSGKFKYYKDVDPPGTADYNHDLIGLEDNVGGDSRYLETQCVCSDWSSDPDLRCTGHGVELDWLRQYWDYLTDCCTKPTMAQIVDQVADAFVAAGNKYDNTVYSRLWNASSHQSRWSSVESYNGVNH